MSIGSCADKLSELVDAYAVEWKALLESLVNIALRLALWLVLVPEIFVAQVKLRHDAWHASIVRVATQALQLESLRLSQKL